MNGNLVVGAAVVLIIVAAIGYMAWQRKNGISSCGCKGCNCCGKSSQNCEGQCNRGCKDKKD